jgi:hypothetical protein
MPIKNAAIIKSRLLSFSPPLPNKSASVSPMRHIINAAK